VVVADVQMPPGRGDDGLRAALELRRLRPETGVLVLSQYYEEQYALDLIGDRPEGVGCLLKERVGDVEAFVQAVARVAPRRRSRSVTGIFPKLGLGPTPSDHRRVLAAAGVVGPSSPPGRAPTPCRLERRRSARVRSP
jgi:DNA-binding NarL/FixJ family response regulator